MLVSYYLQRGAAKVSKLTSILPSLPYKEGDKSQNKLGKQGRSA